GPYHEQHANAVRRESSEEACVVDVRYIRDEVVARHRVVIVLECLRDEALLELGSQGRIFGERDDRGFVGDDILRKRRGRRGSAEHQSECETTQHGSHPRWRVSFSLAGLDLRTREPPPSPGGGLGFRQKVEGRTYRRGQL